MSLGGTRGRPGAAAVPGIPRRYAGQQRIALAFSDERRLALTRQDAAKPREGCDLAVEVREARLDAGTLRLRLEAMRTPAGRGRAGPATVLPAHAARSRAGGRRVRRQRERGGGAGAPRPGAPEPKGYLKAHGVTFEAKPADDPKAPLANSDPTSASEQQYLWRRLTSPPRLLLRVDAELHDPAHKVRHEGETEWSGVVGVHGRLRDVRIATPLSSEQEAHVRRVLAVSGATTLRAPRMAGGRGGGLTARPEDRLSRAVAHLRADRSRRTARRRRARARSAAALAARRRRSRPPPPAQGTDVGVPECDAFLRKQQACYDAKLAADALPAATQALDETRRKWRAMKPTRARARRSA